LKHRITRIVYADEKDHKSEGNLLAQKHGVERAPFFIVEKPGQKAAIYEHYFQLKKDVFNVTATKTDVTKDTFDRNFASLVF
jgi:hypothetical protein